MNTDLDSSLVLLMLGATAVALDGQLIRVNGYVYLQALHGDPDVARSVNRLITALFHLVMLGLAALLSTVDLSMRNPIEVVITKLGIILLALAAAHAATMYALSRVSARPNERLLREEFTRRAAAKGNSSTAGDQGTEEVGQRPKVRG
jgi:4-amino-4-deoxy-L-arabinose transferase-like glycosyltransferase